MPQNDRIKMMISLSIQRNKTKRSRRSPPFLGSPEWKPPATGEGGERDGSWTLGIELSEWGPSFSFLLCLRFYFAPLWLCPLLFSLVRNWRVRATTTSLSLLPFQVSLFSTYFNFTIWAQSCLLCGLAWSDMSAWDIGWALRSFSTGLGRLNLGMIELALKHNFGKFFCISSEGRLKNIWSQCIWRFSWVDEL